LALETVEELIIFIDLDNFKEISEKQGWVNYKPNEITGTLTELVTNFIRKHVGEVIYGLDEKRGTEECMLRLAGALSHEVIISDLEFIASRIRETGFECGCEASVSIGVSRGPYTPIRPTGPYQWSKRLFKGQAQRLAHKALRKAKRQGGNRIVFL
jgi:GGDEF domain-containing protein